MKLNITCIWGYDGDKYAIDRPTFVMYSPDFPAENHVHDIAWAYLNAVGVDPDWVQVQSIRPMLSVLKVTEMKPEKPKPPTLPVPECPF